MKLPVFDTTDWMRAGAIACMVFAVSSHAEPKPAAAPAPPAEPVIAQSVFVLPTAPPEGRDPFYPRSTRPYTSYVQVRTNSIVAPTVVRVDLHLNGISGTSTHPLAIINNRTFEVGELGEVSTGTGHMRIRCLEIRDDAVIIQVGAERRMLHLRSGI